MRKIKLFLLFLFFLNYVCVVTQAQVVSNEEWELVWSDDFDDDAINADNWTHDIGFGPKDDGWGVGGVQNYTDNPKNAFIEDGRLVLQAFYLGGEYDDRNYTSAKLTTKNKKTFQYGRIQARIRMPYGQGIFPAFWMLGQNFEEIGWPHCGEIDIAEMFGGQKSGKNNAVLGNAHYFEEKDRKHSTIGGRKLLPRNEKLADQFRVYEIEWDEDKLFWKVDGERYFARPIDVETYPQKKELHQPFYLILNLGVGSFFEQIGYPDDTTVFPQRMEVDWIRVFKKKKRE